jgi:riboflavin kinase/FMN adenylyltransferase
VITSIHYPDDPRPPRWHQPVLALGNFDGMHRGHLKIIERVRRGAEERGAVALAMTFEPHPSTIVRPDKAPPLLMTDQQKLEALARAGMHGVAIVRFTPELALWDPETFVRSVLVEWLHVAEVWVGANFLFGHKRAGNFSTLRSLGARYGFRAEKIDPVRYKEFVVSSTRIRRLIGEGRVDEAGVLLGHHYVIDGSVVRGQQRGRDLGFPTANLCAENEVLPPRGVYATTVTLDGIAYPSITNIGTRPTFEKTGESVIEAHVLDFDKDLYGAKLRLAFVQRLRDEKPFDGADALKAQIEADRAQARHLFDRMGL